MELNVNPWSLSVLYPEEGSFAETSVKTLLNGVDFTIFNLTLSNYAAQGF